MNDNPMNNKESNHQTSQKSTERTVMIGLEIHGYLHLESRRKLFCDCLVDMQAEPNTTICPVCTAQPGSKPMLPSKEAVEKILAIASLLNCKINKHMLFQRKHYSWPDLPAGYQKTISGSYGIPSAEHGSFFGIRIRELHLEEDPARWDPETGEVDYNRSGYALMELVTEPDFEDAQTVADWLKTFVSAMGYVKALAPEMGIKCDVNVSIAPSFIRTEVKNINSIRSIKDAIEYEIWRQAQEPVMQQTRTYDPVSKKTVFMRAKEDIAQYLFIPEPDLPIVEIPDEMLQRIVKDLPESPEVKYKKYLSQGVDETDANVIARDLALAGLFEKVSAATAPGYASRWFRRDITALADEGRLPLLNEYSDQVVALFTLSYKKRISDPTTKELLKILSRQFIDVEQHIKSNNLELAEDTGEFEHIIDNAIAQSPEAVADVKAGKDKALNSIVGKVMQQTKGKARPDQIKEIIVKKLKGK